MRLSTEPDRDDERSIAVLHAALDAGVTLVDTADAYCLNQADTGHNERLIARALATWHGDRSRIVIATKGGLVRPEGRWEPDGRAKHLVSACEASCRALGVQQIDLYQLHVPDPRTPIATSVRALAALSKRGLIKSIGLCNVTVGQIEEARRIAEIDSVQVELSVWSDAAILSGVAAYCRDHRLPLLAYRPLGGRKSRARTESDDVLNAVAARHSATPFEIALAWLRDLSDVIVPLPGVTRAETAASANRAAAISLTGIDRDALDRRFASGRVFRTGVSAPVRSDGEVVIVMGLPGAGKSTLARQLADENYVCLNRDDAGGTLRNLVAVLDRMLADGHARVVLDNTYTTRHSRAAVIHAAAERGMPVRCIWLSTSIEQAQVNAAERLVSRYGRLPGDDELAALQKMDVAAFLPTVQFRYQRELEPPDPSEGFSRIDVVPFERAIDPAFVNRAVMVWADATSTLDSLGPALRRYQDDGWKVLVMSWQPEIAAGRLSADEVKQRFDEVAVIHGLQVDVAICPHGAGPPRCWCRKPLPGLGVLLIHRHRLDPARCLFIGNGAMDAGLAKKLGFTHRIDLS